MALAAITILNGCSLWSDNDPATKSSLERVKYYHGALMDDLDLESLERAAIESVKYFEKTDSTAKFMFGDRAVSARELSLSVQELVRIFREESDAKKRARIIRRKFDFYKGRGAYEDGNVLITGYYQPTLNGSRSPDDVYKWPIYKKPGDMVEIDLGEFSKELKNKKYFGRVEGERVVPYYDRRAIDRDDALSGRGLEIAWVDDRVELFFLHVQGSGIVRLSDGSEIFVNYAAQNGRKYRSIGRRLIDNGEISREKMSLGAIRDYLDKHPGLLGPTLYHNPSYVFFREMDDGPFGSIGAKLVGGRSAAFDRVYFPRGGLAYVTTEAPVVEQGKAVGWKKVQRFVFSHDAGGAIKGPSRMDLYFGSGRDASAGAGRMKQSGEILFLALKEKVMAKMSAR
ncbi:Membrane-bound lytic murein transglycosylase A [hydrothermal vent metagenome]|uniref:peptidoglycan lytic exotransglycosylase n=1 Tax=hydrothermal vent metagenome TaxID=652676 RepID=A0A3B1BTW4_9ZZZZ